jgi:hypothetical protein
MLLFFTRAFKLHIIVCCLLTVQQSCAASTEYPLKAAFIYNIARMVEWPQDTLTTQGQEPVRLCFYGQDDFGSALDEYSQKKVRKRPVQIAREISLNDAKTCHLVFVSRSEKDNFQSILAQLNPYPILTIGEVPGFAEQGGMMTLLLRDDKRLKIQVNLTATENSGLNVSGRLLSAAEIIEGN